MGLPHYRNSLSRAHKGHCLIHRFLKIAAGKVWRVDTLRVVYLLMRWWVYALTGSRVNRLKLEAYPQKWARSWKWKTIKSKYYLLNTKYYKSLAGTPITVTLSGTSFVTTAPAPTLQFEPMLIPCRITAPEPMRVASPMVTLPEILAPGMIEQ